MKKLFILLLLCLSFISCAFESEMPGYRFSNFKNTEVWDLAKAVEQDDAEKVRALLKGIAKTKVDLKDPEFQQTLLSLAVVNEKQHAVVELLKAGANPNALLGDNGETPFSNAVRYSEDCNLFYLQTLLAYGADVNLEIKNPAADYFFDNSFPLLVAIDNTNANGAHCMNLIKLLVDKGANLNSCYKQVYSDLCEGVITQCLMNQNFEALRYFVIEKNITIPDTVYIYGGVDKNTQQVYGLRDVLKSEHFKMEDFKSELGQHSFSKSRKIRDEIITYLEQKKK